MVALFRDIVTNEPCGIHRTFLDIAGRKLGRKMLGGAGGAAIKLDADEDVTLGSFIGEGVETCLAASLGSFRPVWALGSANASCPNCTPCASTYSCISKASTPRRRPSRPCFR